MEKEEEINLYFQLWENEKLSLYRLFQVDNPFLTGFIIRNILLTIFPGLYVLGFFLYAFDLPTPENNYFMMHHNNKVDR